VLEYAAPKTKSDTGIDELGHIQSADLPPLKKVDIQSQREIEWAVRQGITSVYLHSVERLRVEVMLE
jgi:hypothetical protein